MKDERERMKQLLKQELDSDVEKTIAEVETDESLRDVALPEDLDAGLQDKIKAYEDKQAVYEMLSEEDKEALRIGREAQILRANDGTDGRGEETDVPGRTVRFRKRKRMAFVLAAVVVVLVLAVGMTSIGGKPFIPQLFERMLAGRENININTEEDDKTISTADGKQEDEAYQNIKNQLGFDAVELKELPDGTSFLDFFIDMDTKEACLVYDYQGSTIEYKILANYQSKTFGYDIEDDLSYETSIVVDDVPIEIKCYKIKDTGEEQFMAHFVYNGVNYILNGAMEKEKFVKMIQNLKFY